MQMKPFGISAEGAAVELYTLRSSRLEVDVMTFGARIVDVRMLAADAPPTSVVLGFESLSGYLADRAYMGAVVGRYANRIAHGRFSLGGVTYQLTVNDGPNSLHGGVRGFDQKIWSAAVSASGLTLSCTSPPGEEGYPGELLASVRYSLQDNELSLAYSASASAETPVNLTNHTYFNLCGRPGATIVDHIATVYADQFTPVDQSLIPTGELRAVAGTPFDFRRPHAIGERIDARDPQLQFGQGYDHNWVLRDPGNGLRLAAEVYEPASGRRLEVLTSEPGLQFYTGNHLGKVRGDLHGRRTGLCLETQHFPDSPNHANFPRTILEAGAFYSSQTTYRFSATS